MNTSTFIASFALLIGASTGDWLAHLKNAGDNAHTPNMLWRLTDWIIPDSLIEENVFFYSYTRRNNDDYQQLWIGNKKALANSNFDVSKKTLIVLHGYDTNYTSHVTEGSKKEYLAYDDVNVIVPDYGNINSDPGYYFFYSAAKSFKIGRFLGRFVVFLVDQGVDPDNIHIIGHSLGAHIAGSAAKYAKNQGKTIGRVTGLEPCYLFYENNSADYRLAADDAKFTDCIFTSYGTLGMEIPICQANFFPNGAGAIQPPCAKEGMKEIPCAHSLVVDYFIESIKPQSGFHVLQCDGVPKIEHPPHCWPTTETFMGQYANPRVRGMFYTKTNAQPPYGKVV